ncbi:DUF1799 domain-containing protein [Rhizobium halophytocola]|uniref:DUF1799 domain-containing protein n=1 Tax=Rhizobium halophytocola TaxID=735519 RepID=UPI00360FE6AA
MAPAGEDEDAFEIMSINWPSFSAFLACQTQWRVTSTMAGLLWIGLDYAALPIALTGTDITPALMVDLQAMEGAALEILNEVD